MIQIDKLYHFVVSLVLTIVIALIVKHFEGDAVSGFMCGCFAAFVTMCLGVCKEVWDKFRGTGFDLLDLAADALGCFIAVIFSIFM